MEAKVDVGKLQLLNDRITQVMDALNQVRFSVHGLTHTGAPTGQPGAGFQFGQLGIPQQPQLGFQQQVPYGMGQPWGQLGIPQQPQLGFQPQVPYGMGQPFGLQHTPYSPGGLFGYAPFGQAFQSGAPAPGWGGSPAWPAGFGGGLYHSPELVEQRLIEQRATDPNRILQTFPFCMSTW